MSYRLQYASAAERQQILDYQNRMFVGLEVEHNANLGLKTLFVVDLRPADLILSMAQEHECSHVFFGANYSNPDHFTIQWSNMISKVCETLPASIDISPESINSFIQCGLDQIENLQVQIRLTVPHIQKLLNERTYIKLDDQKPRTNLDVRVIKLSEVFDQAQPTSWSSYHKDRYVE